VIELFNDILTAIHMTQKAGEPRTLYNIGHRARVSNNRLKEHLDELIELGFVDSTRSVTERGYAYCMDYLKQVEPFLRRYGLGRKEWAGRPAGSRVEFGIQGRDLGS
jgi:predicted ArsR family transcriptional regulator